MALGGPHPHTGVSLAVELPLHKEVALLFEVDVTVGTHEAAWVVEFVPGFHHRPAGAGGTRQEPVRHQQAPTRFTRTAQILKIG